MARNGMDMSTAKMDLNMDRMIKRAIAEGNAAERVKPAEFDFFAGKVEGIDYELVDGKKISNPLGARILAKRAAAALQA